jgi:hypothetical protein
MASAMARTVVPPFFSDSVLHMPDIGIELLLAELYDSVAIASTEVATADHEGDPVER